MLEDYLPQSVNQGPWISAYTLRWLLDHPDTEFVLPICSLATPYGDCATLGGLVLPPLFHEALSPDLKRSIIARVQECFPIYGNDHAAHLKVVELPMMELPDTSSGELIAFSVDTAVEQHGPHLPLATDTIQSYSVLRALQAEVSGLQLDRPLEYGQLTWGLPFGFSVDLTTELTRQYVTNYVNAIVRWKRPRAIYVVDVHGSIQHRSAIVEGLQASNFDRWTFRWLHEPLAEFASERGDQHAGGVETALVHRVSQGLVDPDWWPHRIDDIAAGQMTLEQAVELTPHLDLFLDHVAERNLNGIVGDIYNFRKLNADELFARMMATARRDVEQLLRGTNTQSAGEDLW